MPMPIWIAPNTIVSTALTLTRSCEDPLFVFRGEYRSFSAAVADEFNELDKVDMAAAKTAASVTPVKPTGR